MPLVRGECYHAHCPLQPLSHPQAAQIDRQKWAVAYIQQGRSDFEVYKKLQLIAVSACHHLHYPQMACEKVAKAYRLRDTQTAIEELLNSHVGFAKFVNQLLASQAIKNRYLKRDAELRKVAQLANKLAREIEKLAPAVERDRWPANAEYPWEEDGRIVVPSIYRYPNLTLLREPGGNSFLKLVEIAIEEFETITV